MDIGKKHTILKVCGGQAASETPLRKLTMRTDTRKYVIIAMRQDDGSVFLSIPITSWKRANRVSLAKQRAGWQTSMIEVTK